MRTQIILKREKEKLIHNKHPWIYTGAAQQIPEIENGEIIEILNPQKQLEAYAFYAPGNQILARVFEFSSTPLDIDSQNYWYNKIKKAFEIRQKHLLSSKTNAYRLINAEGDFFPGLIADVYNDIVVLQFLIKGTEKIQKHIIDALERLGFKYIYAKSSKASKELRNAEIPRAWVSKLKGSDRAEIMENGIKFFVDFKNGQKTGFFLDQRDARKQIMNYAENKRVLNTFSYSGGFSIYALLAGAEFVHSVDSSDSAILLSEENAALNGFASPKHEAYSEDVFEFLNKSKENAYDLIVLDPPAFAKTNKSIQKATRGYKDLNLRAMKKISKGGIIFTFSCSQKINRELFRKIVFGAAADSGRNVRILAQTTQGIDHPVNIFHPENEYLKGLILQVE